MIKDDEILEILNEKYKIIQKENGYKYGIDSTLLAKFFNLNIGLKSTNLKILDIGTGNGILPFFLYENIKIDEIIGVDIQEENIIRANKALEINNIKNKIKFYHSDIKRFSQSNYFNYIISNPPYMENNGKKINDNEHKKISRHEISLSLEEFIKESKRLLKPIGKLCFIHRTHRLAEIINKLSENKFCLSKIIFIFSPNNKSSMMYIEATKGKQIKLEIENYYMKEGIDYK